MRILVALCTLFILASGVSRAEDVTVLYAGSLVTPMEGPVASALAAKDLHFVGEGKGSTALAHLIEAGLRSPDIFISADERLVKELAASGRVASSVTFGGASMELGFAPTPSAQALLAKIRGGLAIADALRTPGLRIGRTDPAIDPKGARTIRALQLLGLPTDLGVVYPEEDLLVRLETGESDVAFLYSTEATARRLPAVQLPGKAALTGEITYTLAILKPAPHPDAAAAFAAFILHGEGRTILERAGITYTIP